MAKQPVMRWKKWKIKGVGGRVAHTATLVGSKLYIYGGQEKPSSKYQHTFIVVSNTENGYKASVLKGVQGLLPAARNGHTASLVNDRLFIFGGWSGFVMLKDVWMFDFVLKMWSQVQTRGRVPILNMQVSAYIEWIGCILCFGGGDGRRYEDRVNCFDVHNFAWRVLDPHGKAPSNRANHCSCLVGTTWYIFGGWVGGSRLADIHLLHLPKNGARPLWSSPNVASSPTPRVGACLSYFHGNLLLFGGKGGAQYKRDVYMFDVRSQKWLRTSDRAFEVVWKFGPEGCAGHSVTLMPNGVLLVYGGERLSNRVPGCIHTLEITSNA